MTHSPTKGDGPPNRTVMDAFNKASFFREEPKIGFGSGSRPPLSTPTLGPGPGAYQIKTTMGKIMESHIASPCQFSLRGRTKFGDPNEKSMNKTTSNEPGPGQYDLTGKFLAGENPRKSGFPKGGFQKDKGNMGPGPGSYKPLESMGKQVVSTKRTSDSMVFSKADRPSMAIPGDNPGPGQYKPAPAACEPQVQSTKQTCGSIVFGTGYKRGKVTVPFDFSEPSPGPGSYQLPGGIATRAKGSPFRDSPAATMSGRNKFGSPF